MAEVLRTTSTVYWNLHQELWGDRDHPSYAGGQDLFPIQLGEVVVTLEDTEFGDRLLKYQYDGLTVSSWIDTKRLFYHAHLSKEVSRYDLVDWFEKVQDYLWSLCCDSLGVNRTKAHELA